MNTTKERSELPVVELPSEEALNNQEELLVNLVGRVISTNKKVVESGKKIVIEKSLIDGTILSLSDLNIVLDRLKLREDDRNRIGRQIFKTVRSRHQNLAKWIHSEVLDNRYEQWLKVTFGVDRLRRWQLESGTADS